VLFQCHISLSFLTSQLLTSLQDTSNDLENLLQCKAAAFAAYQQLQQGQVGNTLAIVEQFCPDVLQVGQQPWLESRGHKTTGFCNIPMHKYPLFKKVQQHHLVGPSGPADSI
jgi:hypothetical protein